MGMAKTHASAGAAGREDGGGDTDDFAVGVQERAAGVAAVDGGVGLDHPAQHSAILELDGAIQGADDARGEGALELSEGIANDHGGLTDLEGRGIAQGQRVYACGQRCHFDDGQVVGGIAAHDRRWQCRILVEGHFDGLSVGDDVIVGEDVTSIIPHKA